VTYIFLRVGATHFGAIIYCGLGCSAGKSFLVPHSQQTAKKSTVASESPSQIEGNLTGDDEVIALSKD
jgi:hypothetical protein